MQADAENLKAMERAARAKTLLDKKEKNKERQRRYRMQKKMKEVQEGIRSPGGAKRKIAVVELMDPGESKRQCTELAEETRPARMIKREMKERNRKPQGWKQKSQDLRAKYHNWFTPLSWRMIEEAARAAGWQMSPTRITKIARTLNPEIFDNLTRETVRDWIHRAGERPRWSDATLRKVAAANMPGHSNGGPRGAVVSFLITASYESCLPLCHQADYPQVADKIKDRLLTPRKSGIPLTLIAIRGLMIATILHEEPSILERKFHDESTFRVSDAFVRRWLHSALGWSLRKGTRAAQKLPVDWENQCEKSAIRKAYLFKEYDIPAESYANSDQTQRLYAAGNKLTYAETGAKQVSVIGGDEKRAFTVLVTITAAGLMLPFQAIYQGKTDRSCPSPKSPDGNTKTPNYDDAITAGFRFEHSGSGTYWSNQKTMRLFVDNTLAPYFEDAKAKLNLPPTQRSLWMIDVWSVHRSEEFLDWMHTHHPTILIDFVPGGCTGVAQPCDVGIQRPFKHITNQCYLEDMVGIVLTQIDSGDSISIDNRLPILRNASVRWLWRAYEALNKKEIVKKVSDGESMIQLSPLTICRHSSSVLSNNGTCHTRS